MTQRLRFGFVAFGFWKATILAKDATTVEWAAAQAAASALGIKDGATYGPLRCFLTWSS